MFTSGKTMMLSDIMSHCDNLDDFKKDIFSKLDNQKDRFTKKINEILTENNYSQADLARLCGVSRATVLKWTRGSIPQSREIFIKIGFAAHFDLKEMNRFLQRYGRYPELYPKTPEDSIYIFVLNSSTIEHSYASCSKIFSEVENYLKPKAEDKAEDVDTQLVMDELLSLSELTELKGFLENNAGMFYSSFEKFYEYVKDFVRKNNESYVDNENLDNINMLAETLEWSSSLKKAVYSIYKGEWFPLRSKVISLGIHLNMNTDEINQMLRFAKMEPLYIVNPIECIYIYSILEAELDDEIYQGTDDLYNHVLSVFEDMGYDPADTELLNL